MTEEEFHERGGDNISRLLEAGGQLAGYLVDWCRETGCTPLGSFVAMLLGARMLEGMITTKPGGDEWQETLEYIKQTVARGHMTLVRTPAVNDKPSPTQVMVINSDTAEKV